MTRNILLKWWQKPTENIYDTWRYPTLPLTTLTNFITYSSWD